MKRAKLCVALAALAGTAMVSGALAEATTATSSANSCDRDCLIAKMDTYIAAVKAGNSGSAGMARSFRSTLNGLPARIDDPAWATMGPVSRQQYFADTRTGQIMLFAVTQIDAKNVPIMVRLKVGNGGITESESLIPLGPGQYLPRGDLPAIDSTFDEVLPLRERSTRRWLSAIALQYVDGMTKQNGDLVPYDTTCNRLENLEMTANDLMNGIAPLSCRDTMTHYAYHLVHSPMTRVVVMDEERGVVAIMGQIQRRFRPTDDPIYLSKRRAQNRARGLPDDTPIPSDDLLGGEVFKVVNGKIRLIQATLIRQQVGGPTGDWGSDL